MLYKEDWEKSRERLSAFWNNEIVDRCCVSVIAPKNGVNYKEEPVPESDEDLYRYNTDAEWILKRHLKRFETHFYGGEAFPCFWSNFGTCGHAKYFKGADYKFTRETVWYKPIIHDWDTDKLEYEPNAEILKVEKDVMKYLSDAGKGKFFVTMPDNCGNIDALAHLRGTDNLLFDLLEEPDRVKAAVKLVGDALIDASEDMFRIIRENNDNGCTHGWMFTWSPGKSMQLQIDFSVMISPEMYDEFAMPELESMTGWLDNAVYHLDGREQIRHLDSILSLKKLNAIQWTPVAGQPLTSEFIPVLRRIQEAGKGLILYPEKHEIEKLMTGLSSKGLHLVVRDAENEEEAKAIIRKVSGLTREKV